MKPDQYQGTINYQYSTVNLRLDDQAILLVIDKPPLHSISLDEIAEAYIFAHDVMMLHEGEEVTVLALPGKIPYRPVLCLIDIERGWK